MRRTSASVRSRWSRSSFSGSVSQPITDAAVDLGDLAQLVRPGRRAQVARQLGADEDEPDDRHPLGRLEREQAAHPVADDDRRRAEPLERGDDVLGVGVERELGRVRGLRPEVVAQVEGVALPAAPGEVAEVALPQPRAGQLAVDEQQRLAPRAPLGQPRLDVEAAIVELDLVLADRPAVDRRQLGLGEDRRRGSGRATGSPLVRVDDEAGQGLRVEVGRFLGHDVAVAGDGRDGGDRRRLQQERGFDAVGAGVDARRSPRPRTSCSRRRRPATRRGIDAEQPLERGRRAGRRRDGAAPRRPPAATARTPTRRAVRTRPAGARPEPEPALRRRRPARPPRTAARSASADTSALDVEQLAGPLEQAGRGRVAERRAPGDGSAAPSAARRSPARSSISR